MKKQLLLSFLFLGAFTAANSQKVNYKDDTVYVDKKPYCVLKNKGSFLEPQYSVSTLGGKEILVAKYPQNVSAQKNVTFDIVFLETGSRAQMPQTLSFANKLAKEVVGSELIKNGELNPEGEKRFVLLHKPMAQALETSGTGNYPLVERNRRAPIRFERVTMADNIVQDNVVIGYASQTFTPINGETAQIYYIKLPNHTDIAEVTLTGKWRTDCKIVTIKDSKVQTFQLNTSSDALKVIADYLVEHYYL
jgi:hypothetical protein